MKDVEITFSCYENKMGIIIDGHPVSEKSSLTQYMNKPFLLWCNKIFERMYLELGDQYRLIYSGRMEEAQIIKSLLCGKQWCASISFRECVINISLQERMIALNKLIKSNEWIDFRRNVIHITVIGSAEILNKYNHLIKEIEIVNLYCEVLIKTVCYAELYSVDKNDRLVLLCDNEDDIEHVKNIDCRKVKYVLMEGRNTHFQKYDGYMFIYSFADRDFFDIFFQCLFMEDLLIAFVLTVKQLLQGIKENSMRRKLRALLASRPITEVHVGKRLEAGCKTALQVTCYPHVQGYVPKLMFKYQFPDVVKCDQRFVYAMARGQTLVEIFEYGTFELVAKVKFEVYTVNRITDIHLSERVLLCGIGDIHQLYCEYLPENADNAHLLTWRSDNAHIAKVDSTGKVKIVGGGKCCIYCGAESVSAKCEVDAKPYLQEIILPDICSNGHLYMNVGEVQQIKCELKPQNAYDSDLIVSSMDLMIINVLGDKLKAVSAGKATVVVENKTKRLRMSFVVHVIEKKGRFLKELLRGWL